MPQNLVEKIAQAFAVGLPPNHAVQSGDFLGSVTIHVQDGERVELGSSRKLQFVLRRKPALRIMRQDGYGTCKEIVRRGFLIQYDQFRGHR